MRRIGQCHSTPFSILCALTLISIVIGPFAAAVALRQGLD
jgi:heme exporter protein B